jgi:hypothetical protein
LDIVVPVKTLRRHTKGAKLPYAMASWQGIAVQILDSGR